MKVIRFENRSWADPALIAKSVVLLAPMVFGFEAFASSGVNENTEPHILHRYAYIALILLLVTGTIVYLTGLIVSFLGPAFLVFLAWKKRLKLSIFNVTISVGALVGLAMYFSGLTTHFAAPAMVCAAFVALLVACVHSWWRSRGIRPKHGYLLVLLGPLVPVCIGALGYGWPLFVYAQSPLDLGSPAYQTRYPSHMGQVARATAKRLRTPADCLVADAEHSEPDVFLQMDWDKIRNKLEAEVCIYRLLSALGGIESARPFLRAQGFSVTDGPADQLANYVEHDGLLRVDGGWHIKTKGPRFPTRGFVSRFFSSIAYGMGVSVYYDERGLNLKGVRISSNTK